MIGARWTSCYEATRCSMPVHHHVFTVATRGKGTYEITDELVHAVRASGLENGQATVFVRHTSCSLIIFENADASARTDLHAYFDRLVPEDAPDAKRPESLPSQP